jgi:hypothetical protein
MTVHTGRRSNGECRCEACLAAAKSRPTCSHCAKGDHGSCPMGLCICGVDHGRTKQADPGLAPWD